ncbi:MAG: FUSC family protein [Burkholderiales bacterium]
MKVSDPDRAILHRAVRVALVLPPLLWLGLHVLHDSQFALVASFGSFAALAMADFMGPSRSRLLAHVVLAVAGAFLVALGTALSNTLWSAVLVMLLVGVGVQFLMALGGQVALGNNAAVLAFVVAVMVPAAPDAIGSRLAGWLVAMACSAAVSSLLWPRHERRDLYAGIGEACLALASLVRRIGEGADGTRELAALHGAVSNVREIQRALGFRPLGPPERQRALLGLVDGLAQASRFAHALGPGTVGRDDRELAAAVATSLAAISSAMAAYAAGKPSGTGQDIAQLVAARHAHRIAVEAAAAGALARGGSGADVVGILVDVFPVRALSYIALALAVDALVVGGHRMRVEDDFALVEPAEPEGAWRRMIDTLRPHVALRSVWLHNSLRAGLALALSVLVAKSIDIGHAFWVVLATLSVLRSNVSTTGVTVVAAVAGTLAGFVLATLAILVLGPHPAWLWATLPFAVFLAAYAPAAISFGAGQAMFALLVVELFNVMAPDGWQVGMARVEAVIVGALVALAASLIMWPHGASAALRIEIAGHVRSVTRFVHAALAALVGHADPRGVEALRAQAIEARHRADEAFASFIGERGAKRVSLDQWAWLARLPLVVRGAGEAAAAIGKSGLGVADASPASAPFGDALALVSAALDDLADRLDDPGRGKDPALLASLAGIDFENAGGSRRADLLRAIAAWVDAHRAGKDVVAHAMALAFGAGWIGYLAHLRLAAEPALDEVAAHAGVPWWR